MSKNKSLPHQLKASLEYHATRKDMTNDPEFKGLIADLNRLDRCVSKVKLKIVKNRKDRKDREDALKQAKLFTASLSLSSLPKKGQS
jgi:GTPase